MLLGYARVSTTDQSLDIQRAALTAAGVEEDHLFEEKVSGKMTTNRPELQRCIAHARKGDTILVTRLDRFARSAHDLHSLLAALDSKGVGFKCLDQSMIDTSSSSATNRLVIGILASVCEFELALKSDRQREGILAAKARGTYKARQSQIDLDRVRELTARGMKPAEIAPIMRISRASVYRALAAIKQDGDRFEPA